MNSVHPDSTIYGEGSSSIKLLCGQGTLSFIDFYQAKQYKAYYLKCPMHCNAIGEVCSLQICCIHILLLWLENDDDDVDAGGSCGRDGNNGMDYDDDSIVDEGDDDDDGSVEKGDGDGDDLC